MLAERTLLYANKLTGISLVIKVKIDAPHYPSRTKGFEQMAGCLVHTGNETAGEHEVLGVDPLQALCNGLTSIDFFLKALSTQGELTWDDGRQYDPHSDALFPVDVKQVFTATLGTSEDEMKRNIEKFKTNYSPPKQ